MAAFTSLPHELLFMVGTFITHPSDMLHLSQSCQQMHRLFIRLLYEHIVLDCHGYRDRSPQSLSSIGFAQPCLAILRLEQKLRSNPLTRLTIRSLSLRVESCTKIGNFGLSHLLPQLTSLNSLHLDIRAPDLRYYRNCQAVGCADAFGYACEYHQELDIRYGRRLSPPSLSQGLIPVSHKLKSLTIFPTSGSSTVMMLELATCNIA